MKIIFFNISLLFLLFSCELMDLSTIVPRHPCATLTYQPPDSIPGTECKNPCVYVYQGKVNFETGLLQINCREYFLDSVRMDWSIISEGYPVYVQQTYWPAIFIRVERPQELCQWDFQFQYQGKAPFEIQHFCHCDDGFRIVPQPSFWEAYHREKGSFEFRFTSKVPLLRTNINF